MHDTRFPVQYSVLAVVSIEMKYSSGERSGNYPLTFEYSSYYYLFRLERKSTIKKRLKNWRSLRIVRSLENENAGR